MTNIILVIILWGLLGGVLASADVTVYAWQFWIVECICAAISILAYARVSIFSDLAVVHPKI